jgi:hypothetical protein
VSRRQACGNTGRRSLANWQRPDDEELGPALQRIAASLVADIPDEDVAAYVTTQITNKK